MTGRAYELRYFSRVVHCVVAGATTPRGCHANRSLCIRKSAVGIADFAEIPGNHPECQPFGRCLHICPDNLLTVSGRSITAEKLAAELKKSSEPMGDHFGGFTFSGGEPLMQPEFLLETAERLTGYQLCIETSGYAERDIFCSIIPKFDFIIMDIKLADSQMHKKYTGVANEKIISNFRLLKKSGKPFLIRTPLIPGITDTPENLTAIKKLIGDSDWEQLAYNTMAGAKYKMLGMSYGL